MSFITYIPADILKPFVKSFAISKSEKADSYKIVPDTSIVMGFQFSGKLSYTENNTIVPLSSAGITGLRNTYRMFNNSENTNTILVMFSEAGAGMFFNQSMHEIYGSSLSLDDLILRSQMDVIVDQLNEAKTDIERINLLEKFLIARINHKANDELVNLAVMFIKQQAGNIKIAALAEKLNISQSQLEKRFRKLVGASPKKFASIVRLKHILSAPGNENKLTALGLDAGYFDQAHFIKDFKSFTGETPEQFLKGK
jgi:AraC-like DNA-binding protein